MLDLQADAQAALQGEVVSGLVRLGVPDDYASRYLTPVLKRFAPRHGGVEIQLDCEQSTSLIPRVARGELDLALVSRDHARRGTLLFHEPLVWVGSSQFDTWSRNPLPIAVYEEASLGRRSAIHSLALQGRPYKVVYNSSSLAGQIAAVESGLAVAALTQTQGPIDFLAAPGVGARVGAVGADAGGRLPQPCLTQFEGRGQPSPHAGANAPTCQRLSHLGP